ncbi:hypothetical protein BLOT_009407 [Blomia tropicalis]|nr:hypothetical protein BLOT_009407 [Blomia tropicalis]
MTRKDMTVNIVHKLAFRRNFHNCVSNTIYANFKFIIDIDVLIVKLELKRLVIRKNCDFNLRLK